MGVIIPDSSLIACICEGGAETAIMDILLDNNLLIFKREQPITENVIPRTSARDFEKRYLRVEYGKKIIILRTIDSRSEEFRLSRAYKCQVEVIDVITAPEIEMLVIIKENKYVEYFRSRVSKPSDFCKQNLKISNVKKPDFIRDYFSDPESLISSINEYHRIHRQRNNEASLYDLIKH